MLCNTVWHAVGMRLAVLTCTVSSTLSSAFSVAGLWKNTAKNTCVTVYRKKESFPQNVDGNMVYKSHSRQPSTIFKFTNQHVAGCPWGHWEKNKTKNDSKIHWMQDAVWQNHWPWTDHDTFEKLRGERDASTQATDRSLHELGLVVWLSNHFVGF